MIYPYKCTECGHEEEITMPINAKHPTNIECPNCKKITLKRQWTNCRFVLSDDFREENRIHYDRPHPGRHQFY